MHWWQKVLLLVVTTLYWCGWEGEDSVCAAAPSHFLSKWVLPALPFCSRPSSPLPSSLLVYEDNKLACIACFVHSAASKDTFPWNVLHCVASHSSVQVCWRLLADCQEDDGRSKNSDISSTGSTAAVQIYISSTGGSSSTVHKVALLPVLPVKTAQRQPSPSFTAQLVSQLTTCKTQKMRDELWTVVGQKCVCRVVQHTISATQC